MKCYVLLTNELLYFGTGNYKPKYGLYYGSDINFYYPDQIEDKLNLLVYFENEEAARLYLAQLLDFDDVYEFGAEFGIEPNTVYHRNPQR